MTTGAVSAASSSSRCGPDLTAVGIGGIQGALFASGFPGRAPRSARRRDHRHRHGLGGGLIRDLLLTSPRDAAEQLVPPVATAAALSRDAARRLFRASTALSSLSTPSSSDCSARSGRARRSHRLPVVPAVSSGVRRCRRGILRDVIVGLPVAIMHVGSLYAVAARAGRCARARVAFGAPSSSRRRSPGSS